MDTTKKYILSLYLFKNLIEKRVLTYFFFNKLTYRMFSKRYGHTSDSYDPLRAQRRKSVWKDNVPFIYAILFQMCNYSENQNLFIILKKNIADPEFLK